MLSGKNLAAELNALKESKKITAHQIAEKSGIPASTISRVLSGQTDNPSFQTIYDIVKAMDGSLDALVGITSSLSAGEKQMYERLIVDKDKLIQEKNDIIKSKDKWITRLFIVCAILFLVAIAYIIYDIANGQTGILRY